MPPDDATHPSEPWLRDLDAIAADADSADPAARDEARRHLNEIGESRHAALVERAAAITRRRRWIAIALCVPVPATLLTMILLPSLAVWIVTKVGAIVALCWLAIIWFFGSAFPIIPRYTRALPPRYGDCRGCGASVRAATQDPDPFIIRKCSTCGCPWPAFQPPANT